MPFKVSKRIRAALAGVLFLGAGLGGYIGYLKLVGNFHTVIEGQLYRSAQPTPSQLETYVREHGIKTVINLRGENSNADWYGAEIAATRDLGVEHIDFRMSATTEFTPQRASEIVAIMEAAPKPILIHCQGGSDRSGLVSALYSNRIAGVAAETAERQLSLYYGHVGVPHLSAAYAMDESWEALELPEGDSGRHVGGEISRQEELPSLTR
jgi:protein tyrosine/serine phosphatase